MMNDSYPLRTAMVFVFVTAFCAATLTGCGIFGDDDVATINDEEEDEPDEAVVTEVLLDEEISLVDGYSETIDVDVPEEVLSVAINVTDGPESHHHFVTDWQHENGFQIVRDGWESGQLCDTNCNNRVMLGVGAFAGLAPNNPDSVPGVEPGTHHFKVGTAAAGSPFGLDESSTEQSSSTVRVTVYAELVYDEVPEEGMVDLNIFFTGTQGWNAEDAEDDADVQELIHDMDEIYDQIGIDVGEVAFYDVSPTYQTIQDPFSGTGDLEELFAHSEQAELDGPSLFFVDTLHGGGGILGISGGIPGPMVIDGTPRSGVAIAVDSTQAPGSPGVAKVTAHELGHYLGLFHTSEQNGGHDPLPDTEENDQSYLMHATGGGDEMSEWQGRVLRQNPWVYHE